MEGTILWGRRAGNRLFLGPERRYVQTGMFYVVIGARGFGAVRNLHIVMRVKHPQKMDAKNHRSWHQIPLDETRTVSQEGDGQSASVLQMRTTSAAVGRLTGSGSSIFLSKTRIGEVR